MKKTTSVAKPVAASDGVVEMIIEQIVGLYHGSGATLGRDVWLALGRPRDQRDLEPGVGFAAAIAAGGRPPSPRRRPDSRRSIPRDTYNATRMLKLEE